MSRHAACKLPAKYVPEKLPVSIPIYLRPNSSAGGITVQVRQVLADVTQLKKNIAVESAARKDLQTCVEKLTTENANLINQTAVQVRKVSADVSELQKNMELESAARNDLQICVERLMTENAAAENCFVQDRNRSQQKFIRIVPVKSLMELDALLNHITENDINFLQWTNYIKLLGGNDFNSSLKIIINTIMVKSVQKQISIDGYRTKKISLKSAFKEILDGIHIAMNEKFQDYTIAQGEEKIKRLLQSAK